MTPLSRDVASEDAVASASPPVDDSTLVDRTLGGDRAAFASIMRRYNSRLYRLARATLRDDMEAEDALQDAYLAAYRSLGQFRRDAALSTWLSRLVLNQCFTRMRREARRHNVVPITRAADTGELENVADPAEGPEVDAMRGQLRALLERKLDELPEDFRLAFVMREVEDMSVGDVAQCLGIAEATVRSRAFRARALLRVSLARDLEVVERDVYEFGGARCDRTVAAVLARLADSGSDPS
ncbi:MAG TPA: RNA polymerase sigma factor [Steroidobacteraceae bacterium]|nr:RNA polymerase sigma factor [Steroidobacteraceae bacterium]